MVSQVAAYVKEHGPCVQKDIIVSLGSVAKVDAEEGGLVTRCSGLDWFRSRHEEELALDE